MGLQNLLAYPLKFEVKNKKAMIRCCCHEKVEQLLQPIMNSPQDHQPLSSISALGGRGEIEPIIISPMNSNFSVLLSLDTLWAIFEKLPLEDLARAACVCRIWNSVASDREFQIRVFKSPWKLKDVAGNPSCGSFWKDNSISKFAISHRILRGDTVAGLAVKYSVQVYFSVSLLIVMRT